MDPNQQQSPQYDPNEVVTIHNRKTGAIKKVPRVQLPQFGLPTDYQSPVDVGTQAIMQGNAQLSDIPSEDKMGVLQGLNSTNYSPESKVKQDTDKVVKDTASKLVDLMNSNVDKTSPQYKTQLAQVASMYAAAKMGGKDPSNIPAFMQGQIPTFEPRDTGIAGILQGIGSSLGIGHAPGALVDNEDRLKTLAATDLGQKIPPSTTPSQELPSIPGFIGNAASNTKDLINGVATLPSNLINQSNQLQSQYGSPADLLINDPRQYAKVEGSMLTAPIRGTISEFNQALGEPLKGGDIVGRAASRAYQKPVTTVLDALTLVNGAKGLANGLQNGAANAAATEGGTLPSIADDSQISNAQSRALSSVARPSPRDILENDKTMQDVMQMTDSNLPRDMARELPGKISKLDSGVSAFVKNMDTANTAPPVSDVLDQLRSKLENSDAATIYPDGIDRVVKMAQDQLGDEGNFSSMNDTRKFMNTTIRSNWFKSGQPMVSNADALNQMKWDTSTYLKDLIGQNDPSGVVQDLLDHEHSAIQAYPSMSQDALTVPSGIGRGRTSIILRNIDKALNPVRVGAARSAAGEASPAVQAALNGQMPSMSGAISTSPDIPSQSFGSLNSLLLPSLEMGNIRQQQKVK